MNRTIWSLQRRPVLAKAAFFAVSIALLLSAPAALSQSGVAGSMNAPASSFRRFVAALGQLKVTTCGPTFQQAGAFLFEHSQAGFVLQPLGPDPNRWPIVATIESSHGEAGAAGAQTRLTSLIVAPSGSCAGMYQQVVYWPKSCAAVKASVFAGFKSERPLMDKVRQSELSPGVQVYLMPAGEGGCVSIKKELIG